MSLIQKIGMSLKLSQQDEMVKVSKIRDRAEEGHAIDANDVAFLIDIIHRLKDGK